MPCTAPIGSRSTIEILFGLPSALPEAPLLPDSACDEDLQSRAICSNSMAVWLGFVIGKGRILRPPLNCGSGFLLNPI